MLSQEEYNTPCHSAGGMSSVTPRIEVTMGWRVYPASFPSPPCNCTELHGTQIRRLKERYMDREYMVNSVVLLFMQHSFSMKDCRSLLSH